MKWQSPGLGKSGLCFMFYNILEKEGASIFDTPSYDQEHPLRGVAIGSSVSRQIRFIRFTRVLDCCTQHFMRPHDTGRGDTKKRARLCPRALTTQLYPYLFFNRSRISVSNFSSADGSGTGAGAAASSFLRITLPIRLTNTKIENAIIRKSNVVWRKLP